VVPRSAFELDMKEGIPRVSQRALFESVVSRYRIDAESDLSASQSADVGLRRDDESVCDKPVRATVGNLIWLTYVTRPDRQCGQGSCMSSPRSC